MLSFSRRIVVEPGSEDNEGVDANCAQWLLVKTTPKQSTFFLQNGLQS